MTLKLEININSEDPNDLIQVNKLIREGWDLQAIGEPTEDRPANDFLFVLIRD